MRKTMIWAALFAAHILMACPAWADTYAVVDSGGKVQNMVVWDGNAPFAPPAGTTMVPASPGAQVGATYSGGKFTFTPSAATQPLFSATGCGASAVSGSDTAGTFTSGTMGVCTVVIGLPSAPSGWNCSASDRTTGGDLITQNASTPTTATLTGVTAAGDVIGFNCQRY